MMQLFEYLIDPFLLIPFPGVTRGTGLGKHGHMSLYGDGYRPL
jgi:hypothetical protein